MYTLDTNAILYYLKDDNNAVTILRGVFAQSSPVYVSAVTELELLAFSNLTSDEELAALVRRRYRIKVPDSIIAATAMFTGSTLLTRNTRDFRMVSNLVIRKI